MGSRLCHPIVAGCRTGSMVGLVEVAMQIKLTTESLNRARWQEYATRFIFGGLITVIAGIIAKEFGPSIGGLFLAFPAILPATVTLVEKHEKEKKEEENLRGKERGREAASVDAAGASIGSIGLFVFAAIVSRSLSHGNHLLVLASATLVWLA